MPYSYWFAPLALALILILVDVVRVARAKKFQHGDHFEVLGVRFISYFFVAALTAIATFVLATVTPPIPPI